MKYRPNMGLNKCTIILSAAVSPVAMACGAGVLVTYHCRNGEDRVKGPDEEREEEFATGPLSLLMQVSIET